VQRFSHCFYQDHTIADDFVVKIDRAREVLCSDLMDKQDREKDVQAATAMHNN
jgi:hypothetical protein